MARYTNRRKDSTRLQANIESTTNDIETKVDTVDTVVDRIEVDTTSIETKVDTANTNINLFAVHSPLFTGSVFYVNSAKADDTGAGTSPETAKKTISAAIALVSDGDAIAIKSGNYDEALVLANDGLELWFEIGCVVTNTATATQTILVSGNHCRIRGHLLISQAGQIGIKITGTDCDLSDIRILAPTIGVDCDAIRCHFTRVQIGNCTVTGFDLGSEGAILDQCGVMSTGGSTRGFYISGATSKYNQLLDCYSVGNTTAGFHAVLGSSLNVIDDCVSGGGDGGYIDLGTANMWSNLKDQLPTEHHEHIWPVCDGEGTATGIPQLVTDAEDETNGAASTQYYWGEPYKYDPATIARWDFIGLYISARIANDDYQWEVFEAQPSLSTLKSGGNDWDEGATVLTVVNPDLFEVDNLVAICSSAKNCEIQKITDITGNDITVARETSQFVGANTGLRWNHTTGGTSEKMYRIREAGLPANHPITGLYSAATPRDFSRFVFHTKKTMEAASFILMRLLNLTDNANGAGFGCSIIYED